MKDYSESIEPIRFRINDDIFEAVPTLPGDFLRELVSLVGETDGNVDENDKKATLEKLDAIFGFLDKILYPASAERFAERMKSLTEPIGFKQAIRVFSDLLKEYTESEDEETTEQKAELPEGSDESTRPTPGASSSSDGAPTTGTSSAAEPVSEASTSDERISG